MSTVCTQCARPCLATCQAEWRLAEHHSSHLVSAALNPPQARAAAKVVKEKEKKKCDECTSVTTDSHLSVFLLLLFLQAKAEVKVVEKKKEEKCDKCEEKDECSDMCDKCDKHDDDCHDKCDKCKCEKDDECSKCDDDDCKKKPYVYIRVHGYSHHGKKYGYFKG